MNCTHLAALETHGLRRTKDRHRILRRFDELRAWSVAELQAALPRIDLSTVYRNVQKLTDAGVLAEIRIHGKEARYERADRAHHDHLVCDRCAAARCVPCPVDGLTSRHSLELYGTCEGCAA